MPRVPHLPLALVVAVGLLTCDRSNEPGPFTQVPQPQPREPAPRPTPEPAPQPAPRDEETVPVPPGPIANQAPYCDKSQCGPAPGRPTRECADPQYKGGRGPCVRFADGHCGWLRQECPNESDESGKGPCTPQECGTPPAASRFYCGNRQATGQIGPCVRARSGACGWVHRSCGYTGTPAPRPRPQPTPQPSPQPAPGWHACDPLPPPATLQRWPVREICEPSGGPIQPDRTKLMDLRDGTFIIEERRGCYRAKYKKCYGK